MHYAAAFQRDGAMVGVAAHGWNGLVIVQAPERADPGRSPSRSALGAVPKLATLRAPPAGSSPRVFPPNLLPDRRERSGRGIGDAWHLTCSWRRMGGMPWRARSGVWGLMWGGTLMVCELACAGKSMETGNAESNGGSAGSAGTAGGAGRAGAPMQTPVNRFACQSPQVRATGIESCILYTRRTGHVSCQPLCAESCVFQCLADSQCPANDGCDCPGGSPPTCVPIGCSDNSDCLPGFDCASYSFGCGSFGYACQLPNDECITAADCSDGSECAYTEAGRKCGKAPDCLL